MTKTTQDRARVKGGNAVVSFEYGCKTKQEAAQQAKKRKQARALQRLYPKQGVLLPTPKDKEDKSLLWSCASWELQPLELSHWLDHIDKKHVIVTFAPDSVMAWDIDQDHPKEAVITALRFLASHGLDAVATPSTSGQGWHVYAFFTASLDQDAKEAAHAIKNGLERVVSGIDRVYPSGLKLAALGRYPLLTAQGRLLDHIDSSPKNDPKNLASVLASMGSRVTRWLLGQDSQPKTPSPKKRSSRPHRQPAKDPITQEAQLTTPSTRPHHPKEARANVLRDIRHAISAAQYRHDPIDSQPASLQEAVHRLASAKDLATLLARLVDVYPKKRSWRHDLTLRVAPLLWRFGLYEEEARACLLLVAKHAQDQEAKKRAKNVTTTYKRLELGLSVAQVPSKTPSKTAFCAVAWGQDLRSYRKEERSRVALYRVLLASIAHAKKTTPKKLEHDPITQEEAAHDPIDASKPAKTLSTRALSEMTGITRKTISKTLKEAQHKGLLAQDMTPSPKAQTRVKRLKIVLGVNTKNLVCDALDQEEADRLERYRNQHAKDRVLYRQGWHKYQAQEGLQDQEEAAHWLDALDKEAQRHITPSVTTPSTASLDHARRVAQRHIDASITKHDLITKEEAQHDPIDASQPAKNPIASPKDQKPHSITQDCARVVAQRHITQEAAHDPIDASKKLEHDLITQEEAQGWLFSWLERCAAPHHPIDASKTARHKAHIDTT